MTPETVHWRSAGAATRRAGSKTPELISPDQPDLREKSGAGISKSKRAVNKAVKV